MSLIIKNITELPTLDRLKPVAGRGGINRIVASAGIADYEFTEGFEDRDEYVFEKDSFVISSLLFAKDNPEKILPAVKALYGYGVAGFAYKNVIFEELPEEVIDFANEKDFPIYVFGRDLYFEDIIYRVIAAVRKRDSEYLSEENLRKMIEGGLTSFDVEEIAKGVSLLFKKYAQAVFIKSSVDGVLDVERAIKAISLSKVLKTKAMIAGYGDGLFVILTSDQKEKETFHVILREIIEVSGLKEEQVKLYKSRVHKPFEELDKCIRESWHTLMAERAEEKPFSDYDEIGTYKFLIPLAKEDDAREYAKDFLNPFELKEDLIETLEIYVKSGGDVQRAADEMNCHPNTIRYRVGKAKKVVLMEDESDAYFYEQVAAAIKIKKLNNL